LAVLIALGLTTAARDRTWATYGPPHPSPERSAVKEALDRAGPWLAAFPAEDLRFDAAVGLWHIRQHVDSEALRSAWERAREIADRDDDNPLRSFWDRSMTAPAEATAGWEVPNEGARRVNTNRVISEALHCAGNGWRPETTRYVAGPMRDDGGFHTTHALWAVHIARRNGCLSAAEYRSLAATLQRELRGHQSGDFRPGSTREIDLYGERLLMLLLTEDRGPPVPDWVVRLAGLQNDDGSWGIEAAGEDHYARYHATMVAAWALAVWSRDSTCAYSGGTGPQQSH
jgi:hypothetical protein